MFRKLILSGWYFLIGLLLLFAIAISVVRAYPSIYQHYLPQIQQNISSILGKPVLIELIQIDWYGFTPQITASNVTIFEDDSGYDALLNVDEAVISIDTYRSLMRRKITFSELTFSGGDLQLVRTADERIILNGIDISKRLAERKKLNKSNELNINLLNSSISITDEIQALDYFFDRVDIVLGFSGDHFKVYSKFVLPQTLGDTFVLSADIRDLDKGFKNIKGRLYSKGKNINLELLSDFFPKLQVGVSQGVSDFNIWGNFNSLKQRTFLGDLSLRELVYKEIKVPIKNAITDDQIVSIDTSFKLQGDIEEWQLALNDVVIKTSNHEWPGKHYEVSCKDCGQKSFILSTAFDYLNTEPLLSTLQHFPFIAEKLNKIVDKIAIKGVLKSSQLQIQINENKLSKYAYNSLLQEANISLLEQDIAITSIVGMVMGDHLQGNLELTCDELGISVNKILSQPLVSQKVQGKIIWQHKDGDISVAMQNILVESDEMIANMQGMLQVADEKPYIDLQVNIPQAETATIKKYLPYGKMKPKLSKWLSESIVAGTLKNGKLLFHGNPKYFPFKNKPGRIEIVADIEDGVLSYRPNWPIASNINTDFKIDNSYLEINARQGNILDSSINQVHAKINDLKLPRLILKGSASGPANNILEYLQQSSILKQDSKVIEHLTASGNTNLDLDLSLTLTKKLEKQILVGGEVEFDNAGLTLNALSLPFTNLNGKLRFDQAGAEGNGLRARLYGIPISGNAVKSNDGGTLLSILGDFDLDAYLSTNYTKLNKYIKGIAPVTAEVGIPRFAKDNTDKLLTVNVDSDLYGVTTLLPLPFKKAFDETIKISIQSKHSKKIGNEIFANLDNQTYMLANIDEGSKQISKMELRMGDDQFGFLQDGIKITGKTNRFVLSEWRELMSSNQDRPLEINEIDLKINHVELDNLSIDNVTIQALKKPQFWVGDIDSSVAKGKFEYPIDYRSGSVATADFDYLRFSPKVNATSIPIASQSTGMDPRRLPALVINANTFEYKDAVFSDVSLKTKPSTNGLEIDSLQGNGRKLQISANGKWVVDDNDKQRTNLLINLTSQNLHDTFAGLGFGSSVSDGEGSIQANFEWPNAPYQFSLSKVTGDAKIRFKDGAISSVEPGGAGRLIGLFNFGEISRRLSLDFTDFFSKGYAFEKIRGDLIFKDANLTTENLKIKGPSADLLIQGRTGIEAQDYDQIVTVTPHVSGGLPWIGLAVGGPLGAVGVLVGEKIAKSIGVDVNKVTQVQYSMTGSWQDPVIEPISQKVVDNKPSPQAQGQPTPGAPP